MKLNSSLLFEFLLLLLVVRSKREFMNEGFRASLNLNLCKSLELQLFAGWAQN